jgi:hypothetical protein
VNGIAKKHSAIIARQGRSQFSGTRANSGRINVRRITPYLLRIFLLASPAKPHGPTQGDRNLIVTTPYVAIWHVTCAHAVTFRFLDASRTMTRTPTK